MGLGKNTQLSTGNLGFSCAILKTDIHLPLWGYVTSIEKLAVSPGLKKKKSRQARHQMDSMDP